VVRTVRLTTLSLLNITNQLLDSRYSGSNSLEESFFFIPSDEGPSVGTSPTEYQLASRAGTSPYHVDVAGPRGHSASSGRNMIASDLGGSPGSGSAGSAGAVARSPRFGAVDRNQLGFVLTDFQQGYYHSGSF
jgi:hypothetical protein